MISEITLGEEQQNAIRLIKDFLRDETKDCFTLTGSAGTGKTFITKILINYLEKIRMPYCLCAPTHKAALVLKQNTDRDAMTLHRLLALSPNLDILTLDLNNLLFRISNTSSKQIPNKGIVIIDEASMISDDLYDCLYDQCRQYRSKILFIGDRAQLLPVKAQQESKALSSKNHCHLTKIYRQSDTNGLLPILCKLRTECIDQLPEVNTPEGKLNLVHDVNEFLNLVISDFKIAIKNKNILFTKIAAYTNKRVDAYNEVIHKVIAGVSEYIPGEFLTCGENLEIDFHRVYNSMDYIITDVKETQITLPEFSQKFSGFELTILDPLTNELTTIKILSKFISDSDFTRIAEKIEELRQDAIHAPKFRKAVVWRKYYNFLESFTTPVNLMLGDGRLIRKKSFDYGYASTTHKLQGSSYDTIYIDWRNLNNCSDEIVKRQLQYVSLSRTRSNACVLT